MNIDKNKIIKMVAILAAILVIVGSIAKITGGNSMTLAEYAQLHPTPESSVESLSTTDVTPSDVISSDAASTASPETQDSAETVNSTTENLQNTPEVTLTGAALNKNTMAEQRISYTEDFYYEPLSDNLQRYITGVSYPASLDSGESPTITYEELRYLHILHYDFDGNLAEGELICNEAVAQDLVEIFYELYRNEYQLEKVLLIDEYNGDDIASMEDNNTSCFNYRVVEDTTSLSKHALGIAVDINPLYNPYITYEKDGSENISPASALAYADRTASFPYKIDENDLCYKLFTAHGFTWGGNWNSCKDYQHFQKAIQ